MPNDKDRQQHPDQQPADRRPERTDWGDFRENAQKPPPEWRVMDTVPAPQVPQQKTPTDKGPDGEEG
jgi:hypothetical protein